MRTSTEALAGDPAELTAAERLVLGEEESLLEAVRGALETRRRVGRVDERLVSRLRDLREEALESTAKDLPTVFQEMGVVRAVMERQRPDTLPDPDAPYFAHLRIREGEEVRDYCLGRHTFVDREAGVRVVDWRYAPVASLFYRYREGDDFEEPFPGRVTAGVVVARRVVVVDRGRLARVSTDAFTLHRGPDGAWRATRGEHAAMGAKRQSTMRTPASRSTNVARPRQ